MLSGAGEEAKTTFTLEPPSPVTVVETLVSVHRTKHAPNVHAQLPWTEGLYLNPKARSLSVMVFACGPLADT